VTDNPSIEEYTAEQTEQIKALTLTVATTLGLYIDDLVIVGGLVPTLLLPPSSREDKAEIHAGTQDLDIGLDITIFDKKRYAGISKAMRSADFERDENESGNPTRQRWRHKKVPYATIDFLIQQTDESEEGGAIKGLQSDFGAFVIPGLELAFRNPIKLELSGKNLKGAKVTRTVNVCNPGVFVLLKARANYKREKAKDAYDIFYMLRNHKDGIEGVARYVKPLADETIGAESLAFLRSEFADEECTGPMRVVEFHNDGDDPELMADVIGDVAELLRLIED
jgi:hypothetical protein